MNGKTYAHCDPTSLLETVGYDREIFTDWVTMFLDESLSQFDAVVAASEAQNMHELEFNAHALKGTVGQTGATGLIDMLLALESEAQAGACPHSVPRLDGIRAEIMVVREEMQHFMLHGDFSEP